MEILYYYLLYAAPTGYFFTHFYPFPQLDLKLLEGKDEENYVHFLGNSEERLENHAKRDTQTARPSRAP